MESIQWSAPLLADLPHSSLHLDVFNPRQLQQVALNIRQEIAAATFPESWMEMLAVVESWEMPAVILRPSFALPIQPLSGRAHPNLQGLLAARVCPKQPEALASALKEIWADLFRARSLFYWHYAGIQIPHLKMAVLVQPLGEAIASGTLQPWMVGNSPYWEIQATWGLGNALVKGEVIPDFYQVQAETGAVVQQLGSKTRTYRLAVNQKTVDSNGYLSVELVREEEQQRYALTGKDLQALIAIAQQLRREIGQTFGLEWTLCPNIATGEPELQIVQISEQIVHTKPSRWVLANPAPKTAIVKGLGAAAGRAVGVVRVVAPHQHLKSLAPGQIIVVQSITPDWLPLLKKAAGVVAEQGGLTCHAAILARELGIPAVVGATGATQLLVSGKTFLIDGDRGEVYALESQVTATPEVTPVAETPPFSAKITTQLMANLSQISSLEKAANLPLDGVGLLRSELMLLEALRGQHPQEWINSGRQLELGAIMAELVGQFAEAFAPRPVFYRSLDWRSHEFPSFTRNLSRPAETNPMLGWRGTFSYQQDSSLFDLELTALAQVQQLGYGNLRLLLPFVRTVEEFSFCRQRVELAGLTQDAQFELWIMAEVPSVIFLLPDYVQAGVQGISIGTNDLTQLLLGVDREQAQMATVFNERHPAVIRAIKQLIQLAKQAGIPCSICGQAPAQYPEMVEQLVQWGITAISVELDAVERTYSAIARAENGILRSCPMD
jgi:pyruvate,water dikinase